MIALVRNIKIKLTGAGCLEIKNGLYYCIIAAVAIAAICQPSSLQANRSTVLQALRVHFINFIDTLSFSRP